MCNQEGALMAFVACQVLRPASQWWGPRLMVGWDRWCPVRVSSADTACL
jgi:hypothetical protein